MHRGKLMNGDKKEIVIEISTSPVLVHFMRTVRYENFLAHILDEQKSLYLERMRFSSSMVLF